MIIISSALGYQIATFLSSTINKKQYRVMRTCQHIGIDIQRNEVLVHPTHLIICEISGRM